MHPLITCCSSHQEPGFGEDPTARKGPIPDGSIGFLKGAARVTTAIAAVVACDQMAVEVGWDTNNVFNNSYILK